MRRRRPRHPGTARAAAATLIAAAALLAAAAAAVTVLAALTRRAERAAATSVRSASDIISAGGRGPAGGDAPVVVAIVVLGATVYAHGPCDELRARLDHAVTLWRLGVAPQILVTGGIDGDIDEAGGMAAYLAGAGVPVAGVTAVRPGSTTRESLQTLHHLGPGPYVVVSSPYHALRIRTEARRQGLRVTVSAPSSTPEMRRRATYRVRFASELFAMTWYALPPSWTRHVSTRPGTVRHVAPRVLSGQVGAAALLEALRGSPS